MIIVPIGHDKLIRRLPYLTIAIMARIFLDNLEDKPLGKGALEFLIKNYPDYSGTHEAQTILMKYNN